MTLYYRHVLVAVDLSEQDTYVVRKARHLAQVFDAKLSIIHVLDNIPMPDTAYGTIIPLNEDSSYEMLEAVKAKLRKLGEWMAIDLERRWLVWGVPGEEIVRIARQEHVDLIMVGSHGRHGLGLLMGSTANRVLHHASCDVMAVRFPEEVERAAPLRELVQNLTG
jgi:universal stress protein A